MRSFVPMLATCFVLAAWPVLAQEAGGAASDTNMEISKEKIGQGALAQEGEAGNSNTDLAKQVQNPVADLISLPFQNNMSFGLGPNNRMQNVLNIQPVVPLHLTKDWNLITRTIAPIIKQPDIRTTDEDTWGLGDLNVSAFLSPSKSGAVTWGVGPALVLPTGTDHAVSQRQWAAGPSAVVLMQSGPWVLGALVQNVWSFAGSQNRPDVKQFLGQYFINYNLPDGWYLTSAPIITANWEAGSGNKWTVPIGGGFGKVFRVGKLPINAGFSAFANVVRPDNGPDWSLRFQIAFLFPKSLFSK
ncbi:MAG: transporter [Nitrospira sp.]|jgi:hypothetical protein|nr:transporter [Nitrospira sp.]